MTYFRFHLVFTLPALVVLAVWPPQPFWEGANASAALWVLVAVMVFTTPWDNFAVARGIWGFPRGRYLFRVHHLPIEEYGFFIIQSLMVMLFCAKLVIWLPERESLGEVSPGSPSAWVPLMVALLVWGVAGIVFRKLPRRRPGLHYAWHLLFWFLPVILLQWLLAWPILAPRWDMLLLATSVVGGYLSLADLHAIRQGIWHFDENQITGHKIGGAMPWEEAAFFLLTSLLVAQSYLMLLPEAAR